jgi:hypothetical protein
MVIAYILLHPKHRHTATYGLLSNTNSCFDLQLVQTIVVLSFSVVFSGFAGCQ